MQISGIMPIHNEEEYLPYCLESLKHAPLSELVVLLDGCTDGSEQIIRRFKPRYPVKIFYAKPHKWQNQVAEVVERCFSLCDGDIVYDLFADVIYDPKIFEPHLFERFDMVSFRTVDWDIHTPLLRIAYEAFLSSVFEKMDFREAVWRGCVFGTKREVWKKLHFRDVTLQHGEHLQFKDYRDRLVNAGYKFLYVRNAENIHLRTTTFSKKTQVQEGLLRASKCYPFWRVALHSLIHLKPHVFAGYMRRNR